MSGIGFVEHDDRLPDGCVAIIEKHPEYGELWQAVPEAEAAGKPVIRCVGCDRPAVVVDMFWPWMSDRCRCAEHVNIENFEDNHAD